MRDFFEKIFRQKESLGCDIGAASVKFVRLIREKETFSLQSYGIVEATVLGENAAVGLQRVKTYFRENGISGSKANVNIEDKSLRIRRMDLAQMPDGDLKIAIRWNLREYVDGPIEKYTVGHSNFGDMKVNGDKRPVLAFGVSTEAVEGILHMAKQMGLKPLTVEPNATALLAAFDLNVGWEKGKYHVMIDLGSTVANFIVVGNGLLLFSRPLQGSGSETLKKTIARELSVTPDKAEGYLKQIVKGNGLPEEVSSKIPGIIASFFSQFSIEVQRSIDAFCIMFHVDRVDDIYLSGGGSMLPGVCEYMTKNLGVATKLFNPFAKIDASVANGRIVNPQLYTLAVGLAIPRK